MFKVTVYSALTGEAKWVRFFCDEDKAEVYCDNWFDPDNKKGGGYLMSMYESYLT